MLFQFYKKGAIISENAGQGLIISVDIYMYTMKDAYMLCVEEI